MTPLQSVIGFQFLPPHAREGVEFLMACLAFLGAVALRRRKAVVTSAGFVLLGLGALLDLLAILVASNANVAGVISAAGIVLFAWGLIRLLMDAVEFMARKARGDFSTILRDLISLLLYAAIVVFVLAADFQVNVYSLLASGAVLGVVIGFAVQATLGDIFSGLALQLQKPFDPGDWIRSGQYVGRVQGVGVRSTTVITRANERLEIPNSAIAKEVLTNYGDPPVCDEIAVGLSYSEPPNRVRETILKVMRDVPHVLTDPPPEVLAWEYSESSIKYRVKYWIGDYYYQEQARNALVTSLWYTLRRNGMEIPFPIRTLEMRRGRIAQRPRDDFERDMINELRQVDFLSKLSDPELRLLVSNVQVHQFGAGETLFRLGDNGDSMFIIRRGVVEVIGETPDGKPRLLNTMKRAQFIGEGGMMTGEPRTATCRAQIDVEVLELNREAFAELFKAHPEAVEQISEVIADRASERRELLKDSGTDGKTARRNWWVAKVREIFDV